MIIDNYQARKALVSWLKTNSSILGTLNDTKEVRELDWQGEKFSYPNIRVTCSITIPTQCNYVELDAVISYFSEQKSSKEAIQSQGIIAKQIHNTSFTEQGIKFSNVRVTTLPDAEQVENDVWESLVNISANISEAS